MLAIIPARGGSKGIPRKNLVSLQGRPLIDYTLEAARNSRLITRIIVSTDDDEIHSASIKFGLSNEYLRPKELAEDDTSMSETISHCLEWAAREYGRIGEFIILQPTSPLRTSVDIDNAIARFRMGSYGALVSVNEMREHPFECIELMPDGGKKYLRANILQGPGRQSYAGKYYFINGAIYIFDCEYFKSNGCKLDLSDTELYIMPPERSIDIDTAGDLGVAEQMIMGAKLETGGY